MEASSIVPLPERLFISSVPVKVTVFPLVQKLVRSVAVQEPCSAAVKVPKSSVKSRPSPKALLDSNTRWELPSRVKELTLRSPIVVVQTRVLPDPIWTVLVAPKKDCAVDQVTVPAFSPMMALSLVLCCGK